MAGIFFSFIVPFQPWGGGRETGAARRKNSHRVGAPKEAGRRINGTFWSLFGACFVAKASLAERPLTNHDLGARSYCTVLRSQQPGFFIGNLPVAVF